MLRISTEYMGVLVDRSLSIDEVAFRLGLESDRGGAARPLSVGLGRRLLRRGGRYGRCGVEITLRLARMSLS